MHIVIGVITAIAGLIWALTALQRTGFDLSALNPFTWARRRRWHKMYGAKPIHNLALPIETATVLIVGILKEEGEISREQKEAVLEIFSEDFNLGIDKATEAFASAIFLLKDEINFHQDVKNVLALSKDKFTPDQVESLITILNRVASMEGKPTDSQRVIIQTVERELLTDNARQSTW